MHAKALARTILGLGWRAKINDLCDTLNALLLRDLRCDADEPGQCIPLACPLARVDVLCIRGELDRQISRRILKFLNDRVTKLDDPRSIGQALQGPRLGEFWRYRVGDYRQNSPSLGPCSACPMLR